MKTIFSTESLAAAKRRREFLDFWGLQHRHVDWKLDDPSDVLSTTQGAVVAGQAVRRTRSAGVRVDSVKGAEQDDKVLVYFVEEGSAQFGLLGRTVVQRVGDMAVIDGSVPSTLILPRGMRGLEVELPRKHIERMLGPTRSYSGQVIEGGAPTTTLARTFLVELVRVHEALDPAVAERMLGIGVDLVVASIAERMAREAPRSAQGTATVQRAKVYVEANLHDPSFDPRTLAMAMGVSLRRLQQLFYEHGRHISDWIWFRRLDRTARQLSDPGYGHLTIGEIAYGCGFTSQAHFSTRFKQQFGLSPSDYRRQAMSARSEDIPGR